MRINDISLVPFSSIQVQKSKMDQEQYATCRKLSDAINGNSRYAGLKDSDVDIYMLPAKKGIEVRLLDPYSGDFVTKKGKTISIPVGTKKINVPAEAGKILDYYEGVATGRIARPVVDVNKYLSGKVAVAKINPKKHQKLEPVIRDYTDLGFSRKESENEVFNDFMYNYHENNKDGVF